MKPFMNSNYKSESEIANTLYESAKAPSNQRSRCRKFKFIKLIANNLDSSIPLSEWRRILTQQLKSVAKNSFYIRIMHQSDSRLSAITSMSTLEDAQLAVSHLNRRRIGNRRIYVNFSNSFDQNYLYKQNVSIRIQPKIEETILKSPSNIIHKSTRKKYGDSKDSSSENLLKNEDPILLENYSKDKQENVGEFNQQNLPFVYITLAELQANVLKLLQEHNNLIPVINFMHCYEESFGPFKKATNGDLKEEEDCENNYVPLEHLITSIPGVSIEYSMNGIRVVKLSVDPPRDDVMNCSSTEVMRQLRHEVVDLIKQQPSYSLLLSKFIPTYHSRFNKQFRVSNYGYTRLQDLFESLRGVVHIVGQGPHRTIMLTHLTQVRRFTHELLRMLKTQQRKCLRVDEIPKIYEAVFNKPLQLSNYGVCTIYDLLNDIPVNKLITQSIKDLGYSAFQYSVVMIPQRVQTMEQRIRTNLFALEVIDILSTSQRFQIPFTKFIPAYHHTFNRQCRVADYGFTKFIELLEAIPQTAEVFTDNGERYINLTNPLRLALIRQMLLEVLQSQTDHRMLLNDLVTKFHTKYQLNLIPQDCGFENFEEMLSSFSDIVFLSKVNQQTYDLKSVSKESVREDSPPEVFKIENSGFEINKTFVILVDRNEVRQSAYRCLKILLNSPFGSIPENEFRDSFRAHFNQEIDLEFVNREMNPFILVNSNIMTYHPMQYMQDATRKDVLSYQVKDYAIQNTFAMDMEANAPPSRIVQLCPLILLAQQIRFLLTNTRGRLMISFLEEVYRSTFGMNLCPEVYGYPSLITLINALKFAIATRGRGSRTTVFLAPDFLGKLAWMVAYKIPFRHDLINHFQSKPIDIFKTMINHPNIYSQSVGNMFPLDYPLNPEFQPIEPTNYFQPLLPEPIYIGQGINYPSLPPIDYMNQTYVENFPFYQEQGMALVSPFTYPMATPGRAQAPYEYCMNPPIDMNLITQHQLINENVEVVGIKEEQESVSLSEEAFKSGSAYTPWIPQEGEFMLTHDCQNLTLPNGQMIYPQEETFNSHSAPLQWPIFQPDQTDTHLAMDPQAITINSRIYAENPFGFTSTSYLMNDPNNFTPVTNKCEEGDWTLPISMTTESINDTDAKENDITENIE